MMICSFHYKDPPVVVWANAYEATWLLGSKIPNRWSRACLTPSSRTLFWLIFWSGAGKRSAREKGHLLTLNATHMETEKTWTTYKMWFVQMWNLETNMFKVVIESVKICFKSFDAQESWWNDVSERNIQEQLWYTRTGYNTKQTPPIFLDLFKGTFYFPTI